MILAALTRLLSATTFLGASLALVACGAAHQLGEGNSDLGLGGGAGHAGTGGSGGDTGPCSGVELPVCPARCQATQGELMGRQCAVGERCIYSTVGDECACGADGQWGCVVHAPLGTGCNTTCVEEPSGVAGAGGTGSGDPCEGVALPDCAPDCVGNMGELRGQRCETVGQECIISRVGDECLCGSDHTWLCEVHGPLTVGCNLTCR